MPISEEHIENPTRLIRVLDAAKAAEIRTRTVIGKSSPLIDDMTLPLFGTNGQIHKVDSFDNSLSSSGVPSITNNRNLWLNSVASETYVGMPERYRGFYDQLRISLNNNRNNPAADNPTTITCINSDLVITSDTCTQLPDTVNGTDVDERIDSQGFKNSFLIDTNSGQPVSRPLISSKIWKGGDSPTSENQSLSTLNHFALPELVTAFDELISGGTSRTDAPLSCVQDIMSFGIVSRTRGEQFIGNPDSFRWSLVTTQSVQFNTSVFINSNVTETVTIKSLSSTDSISISISGFVGTSNFSLSPLETKIFTNTALLSTLSQVAIHMDETNFSAVKLGSIIITFDLITPFGNITKSFIPKDSCV